MIGTFRIIALASLLTACSRPLPCDDCEQAEVESSETDSDLPCGGADLQTDNPNCGECGNECLIVTDRAN